MKTDSINDNVHKSRGIVIQSLLDIGGTGNLYEIHNASKEYTEHGFKISVIYNILNVFEIVEIAEVDDIQPHIKAEITGVKEAKTISYLLDMS